MNQRKLCAQSWNRQQDMYESRVKFLWDCAPGPCVFGPVPLRPPTLWRSAGWRISRSERDLEPPSAETPAQSRRGPYARIEHDCGWGDCANSATSVDPWRVSQCCCDIVQPSSAKVWPTAYQSFASGECERLLMASGDANSSVPGKRSVVSARLRSWMEASKSISLKSEEDPSTGIMVLQMLL